MLAHWRSESAARQLGHVNSLAYVLVFVCLIEWLTSSP
jgi:hypothetical protein